MSELADSNISLVNDVFIKQMHFPKAGMMACTHAHVYDHQTLLAAGTLRVTVDGVWRDYAAPKIIVIEAGKYHGLMALEDNTTAYCIHAVKGGQSIDEADQLVMGVENQDLKGLV